MVFIFFSFWGGEEKLFPLFVNFFAPSPSYLFLLLRARMEWPGQSDILKHFFYVIKHVFLNDVNNLTILSKILSLVLLYIHLFFPCRENLFSSCFILDHPYSSCCTEIPQFHIFSCKTWISCIRKLLFFLLLGICVHNMM